MTMMNKQQQKETAINRLKQMDIYKPYITAFDKKGIVTMFENFGGFYATAENGYPELENKIKELNNKGYMVYAITHEYTDFGELYDLLYVSMNSDYEDEKLYEQDGIIYAYAYVWNKSDEDYSEPGEIGVQSMGGGIRRCA